MMTKSNIKIRDLQSLKDAQTHVKMQSEFHKTNLSLAIDRSVSGKAILGKLTGFVGSRFDNKDSNDSSDLKKVVLSIIIPVAIRFIGKSFAARGSWLHIIKTFISSLFSK